MSFLKVGLCMPCKIGLRFWELLNINRKKIHPNQIYMIAHTLNENPYHQQFNSRNKEFLHSICKYSKQNLFLRTSERACAGRLKTFTVNFEQFNFEYQSRICGNDGRITSGTVSIIGSASQFCLLSEGQLWYTFIPTFDHLTNANLCLKWLSSFNGRIKFVSIE